MKIRFTKMHGAGNDFVMLDGVRQRLELTPARVRALADRRRGIGADQVLVVEPAEGDGADFRYRIYNADGGEVEQCGNGARCFVRFVLDQGLSTRRRIRVQTLAGIIEPAVGDDGSITVDMGPADLRPQSCGLDTRGLAAEAVGQAQQWRLAPGAEPGCEARVIVVSMGNPHAVQFVDDVDAAPVGRCGAALERDARFAAGVNAGFAQMLDRHSMRLRVWERGAGETLACGTGACAAAVAAIHSGRADSPVRVAVRGGELAVHWDGGRSHVQLRGPAQTVYEGEIEIP